MDSDLRYILNPNGALEEIMQQRNKYLSMLKSPITQGKDGRWFTRVPDKSKGDHGRKMIRKGSKEEVENAVIAYFAAKEQCADADIETVAEGWQRWYDFKRANNRALATSSFQIYNIDRRRFLDGTTFAQMRLKDVTEVDIENFLLDCVQKYDLSRRRTTQVAGYIKGIFFVAFRDRVIRTNPWERVSLAQVVYPACRNKEPKPAEERIMTTDDVQRLISTVEDHFMKNPDYLLDLGVLISIYTGMRAGEIVALRWADILDNRIDIAASEHRVPHDNGQQTYEIGKPKCNRNRYIPICEKLQNVFDRIHSWDVAHNVQSPFVLFDGNKRYNANGLEKCMKRRGIEANIKYAVTPHRARRTIDSRLNDLFPRATVCGIMGHSEEVDRKYYDYDTSRHEDVRKAIDCLYI